MIVMVTTSAERTLIRSENYSLKFYIRETTNIKLIFLLRNLKAFLSQVHL